STNEDTAQTINVLANDNFEHVSPAVTDVSQGTNGSVTFTVDGNVTYTPGANFNGSDSFTYTVTAGGVTETATVHVNVASVNHPPSFTAPENGFAAQEGVLVPLTGVVFADIDGGAGNEVATFSASAGTLSAISGGGVTVTGNGTGTVTLIGNLASLNDFIADGNLNYTGVEGNHTL